jgi:hypothetical protein
MILKKIIISKEDYEDEEMVDIIEKTKITTILHDIDNI